MFKFLKRRQNNPNRPDSQSSDQTLPPDTVPITTPQNASYRDLTRLVVRDTLRMSGIPLDWVSCDAAPLNPAREDGSLLIQLVVRRWHDGLMTYAPLIQQQVLAGMQRFDPSSDHAHHVVVWKIPADSGYARTDMPKADFWLTPPATAPGKPKFDLPPSNRDNMDDGFAATVPGDFR